MEVLEWPAQSPDLNLILFLFSCICIEMIMNIQLGKFIGINIFVGTFFMMLR